MPIGVHDGLISFPLDVPVSHHHTSVRHILKSELCSHVLHGSHFGFFSRFCRSPSCWSPSRQVGYSSTHRICRMFMQ